MVLKEKRMIVLLLMPMLTFVLATDYYQVISTTEQQLTVTKTIEEVANLALCTAACSMRKDECDGIRYNLPSDPAPNTCTLGKGNDLDNGYADGDFRTHWRIKHSTGGCMARYSGFISATAATDFCNQMGGQLPEMRTEADTTALTQLGGWTPLGLEQDDGGGWRWVSDGAAAVDIDPAPSGLDEQLCVRIESVSEFIEFPCRHKNGYICQFC